MYETLGRHPFGFTSREIDAMEVWEGVSMLGLWRPARDLEVEKPKAGKPVDDASLIRARYAAAARGEPEPTHIFGGSGFTLPPLPNQE